MQEFWRKFAGHFLPGEDNAYRPHLLKKPWLLFFLTVILTAEGLYVAASMAGQSAHTFLSAVVPGEVIALTNNERAKIGDGSLAENAALDAAAQAKAEDMATKGYFSHTGPDGKEPWTWISGAGYAYRYAGENLAVRFDESADVVNAWMASPTHKANIVKPVYTEIGIGVAEGSYEGSPATFIVQYFGTPQSATVAETPATPAPAVAEVPPRAQTSPEVAGAETSKQEQPHPLSSTTPPIVSAPTQAQVPQPSEEGSIRSEVKSFLQVSDSSQSTTAWILGGITTLLLLVIVLTIVVHIEIQPTELILGGAFVAAVAVSLLMLNTTILGASLQGGGQPASVASGAHALAPVMIDAEAAAIGG